MSRDEAGKELAVGARHWPCSPKVCFLLPRKRVLAPERGLYYDLTQTDQGVVVVRPELGGRRRKCCRRNFFAISIRSSWSIVRDRSVVTLSLSGQVPAEEVVDKAKRTLKNSILCGAVFAGILAFGELAAAACDRMVVAGHPDYPPILWTEGGTLDGLPARIFQKLGLESRVKVEVPNLGSWEAALEAVKAGKADAIAGIYVTEERKRWAELITPAYLDNSISVIVARARPIEFSGREDLVGKEGIAIKGESFGDDVDVFVQEKLTVTRTDGTGSAFDALLAGKADYVISGTYPAISTALARGIRDRIIILEPPLVTKPVFLAFSKKSPCRSLAIEFGKRIEQMRASGEIRFMEQQAIRDWDAWRKRN